MSIRKLTSRLSLGIWSVQVLVLVCFLALMPIVNSQYPSIMSRLAAVGSTVVSMFISPEEKARLSSTDPTRLDENLFIDSYAWTARTKLEDLRLNHRIKIAPVNSRHLLASGTVAESERGNWTEFLRWYNQNPAFPPLVLESSHLYMDNSLPRISSVWLDRKPTVVFVGNIVAGIGDKLPGGWQVLNIDAEAVIIGRDDSVVSLSY